MYKLDSFDYITEHFFVEDMRDHWRLTGREDRKITGIAIEKDGYFIVSLD